MPWFEILDPPQLFVCRPCGYEAPIVHESQWPRKKPKKGPRAVCPSCGEAVFPRCGGGRTERRKAMPGGDHNCHARWGGAGIRCNLHGRKTPKGVDHYAFGTGQEPSAGENGKKVAPGEKSRYAPARWIEENAELLVDDDVQRTQRHQLVILKRLEDEAVARLDTGESGAAWAALQTKGKSIRRQLDAIKSAGAAGNASEASSLAQGLLQFLEAELLPVIADGVDEEAGRDEITSLIVKRARVVRVANQAEATMPVEQVRVMAAQFEAVLREFVSAEDFPMVASRLRTIVPDERNGRAVKLVGAKALEVAQ